MAITVNELKGSPSGAGYNAQGHRRYTRMFQAIAESSDDAGNVLLASGVPQPGDLYEGVDSNAFCKDVQAVRNAAKDTLWNITAQYSTEDISLNADQIDDPVRQLQLATGAIGGVLQVPSQVSWSAGFEPKVMEVDAIGRDLLNTVGRPFDPPIETDSHYQVLRKEVNSLQFDTQFFSDYINTINSDVFLGFQPHEVKCASITAQNRYSGSYNYVNATFEFHIKTKTIVDNAYDQVLGDKVIAAGWDMILLNQGFYRISNPGRAEGVAAKTQRIQNWMLDYDTLAEAEAAADADANLTKASLEEPIDEPTPLKINGDVIKTDDLLSGAVDPVYLLYQQYEALPFGALGLST